MILTYVSEILWENLFVSSKDLSCFTGVVTLYFMYHVRALSLKVVSKCTILDVSSVILFSDHIAWHVNRSFSTSSLLVPSNAGSLIVESWFSILDIELFLPYWTLLGVDIDAPLCEVLMTSTSSSLISSSYFCFTLISALSSFFSSWW